MPPPDPVRLPILSFALIGAILAAITLLFAWTAGWLSPGRVSGGSITDALQSNAGKIFPGVRRAHAKGLCVSGSFESNGVGAALSSATLFRPGTVPVEGRFSLAGGNPGAPDGRNVFHALGLRFLLAGGEEWRMALDHTPIFVVATPADFQAFQIAGTPDPVTKKPDPQRIQAFLVAHPETRRFMDYMRSAPLPSSFSNGTYHGIDAFRFTNAAGVTQTVRWQFEPEDAFAALDKNTLDQMAPDALFDEYVARAAKGPVRWHMVVVVANPGDRTNDATIEWQGSNRRVDVGTLTLTSAAPEMVGNCRDIVFDPLILPAGVTGSDDPLLAGRSAAYSASFRRRAREGSPTNLVSANAGATR